MNISDEERKARSRRIKQMRADGRIKKSYPQSQETRDKRAAALRGQKRTQEQRARMSANMKGIKRSPETSARLSLLRKGKKPTELTKARMSATHKKLYASGERKPAMLGKKLSDDVRRKLSEANRGIKSYLYKDGRAKIKRSERQNFMSSVEYKIWRTKVFQRDNYTCQICGDSGVRIHADHIKSYTDYPELRIELSNGRTLCVPCHYYVTYKRKMPHGSTWGQPVKLMQHM